MYTVSQLAPTAPLTAAELRRVFAWQVDRIAQGEGFRTCSGLDDATAAALYAYTVRRDPAALAAAHAANERRIAGLLDGG